MGDPRRFEVFATFIAGRIAPELRGLVRVADVAAGRGLLGWALRAYGFTNIVPFEPAPRRGGQVRRLGIRVENFEPSFARDFDLIVGMHPDGATDCILSGAALHGRMAIVSPCCIRPNAWSYAGNARSHIEWQAHLVSRSAEAGLSLDRGELQMTGANKVLWGGALNL